MDQAEETCHVFPSPKPLHSRITFFSLRMGLFLNRKKAGKIHWLLLLMHLPLVASWGPHSDGERNSMGWCRSLLWGWGWGMKKDHVSEGRRISSWQNPNDAQSGCATHLGGGFFFGVSELPWFSGAKNSPCLTSRGWCLESYWLCRFGDIYQDVSPGPHWPGVSWMGIQGVHPKMWFFSIHKTFFVVFLRDIDGR